MEFQLLWVPLPQHYTGALFLLECGRDWSPQVVPGCIVACLAISQHPLPHPDSQLIPLLLSCWALDEGGKPSPGVGPCLIFTLQASLSETYGKGTCELLQVTVIVAHLCIQAVPVLSLLSPKYSSSPPFSFYPSFLPHHLPGHDRNPHLTSLPACSFALTPATSVPVAAGVSILEFKSAHKPPCFTSFSGSPLPPEWNPDSLGWQVNSKSLGTLNLGQCPQLPHAISYASANATLSFSPLTPPLAPTFSNMAVPSMLPGSVRTSPPPRSLP